MIVSSHAPRRYRGFGGGFGLDAPTTGVVGSIAGDITGITSQIIGLASGKSSSTTTSAGGAVPASSSIFGLPREIMLAGGAVLALGIGLFAFTRLRGRRGAVHGYRRRRRR